MAGGFQAKVPQDKDESCKASYNLHGPEGLVCHILLVKKVTKAMLIKGRVTQGNNMGQEILLCFLPYNDHNNDHHLP